MLKNRNFALNYLNSLLRGASHNVSVLFNSRSCYIYYSFTQKLKTWWNILGQLVSTPSRHEGFPEFGWWWSTLDKRYTPHEDFISGPVIMWYISGQPIRHALFHSGLSWWLWPNTGLWEFIYLSDRKMNVLYWTKASKHWQISAKQTSKRRAFVQRKRENPINMYHQPDK